MKRHAAGPIAGFLWGFLCAATLLGGCASATITASDDSDDDDDLSTVQLPGEILNNRSLAVETGSTPSFYADLPSRRTFGILGVVAMMRAGNQLVETYGLEDPAGHLSKDLVTSLAAHNRMKTSTREAADLLLNVKTINWDFRPYRNDPDNLFVVYSARISLIDQRDGTVLASGKCRSRRDREGDSATLEQLLADGAKRLHTELREAAQECAQRVKSDTLSALLRGVAPVAQQTTTVAPAVARRQ